MDTLQLTRQFLSEQYGIDPATVTAEAPLDKFGIDSLMFVELVFDFETKLGMPIPVEEFAKPKTIGELVALVDELRASKK